MEPLPTPHGPASQGRFVFDRAPLRIYWEVTRACGLACLHCRAEAVPFADPRELSTAEGHTLIDEIVAFGTRPLHLILTGGDPLRRPDFLDLVGHAVDAGMEVALSPAATPLLTEARIRQFTEAGVSAMSLSLDGSTAERHDGLRGVPGTFERTLEAGRQAVAAGMLVQVNTLVAAETLDDLDAIYEVVRSLGVARWSLFFLIQVGRGRVLSAITPAECTRLLDKVYRMGLGGPVHVTTTEAPHYRRRFLELLREDDALDSRRAQAMRRGYGIRDGNGVMFISHTGDVQPSGFLDLVVGNVRERNVRDMYRDNPVFRSLRDPARFGGRCGDCAYHAICGGSRARAHAATGDMLASDPLCDYEPVRHGPAHLDGLH